jgi:hypothetical protein
LAVARTCCEKCRRRCLRGEADGDIIADIAGNGTSINQNDVLVV